MVFERPYLRRYVGNLWRFYELPPVKEEELNILLMGTQDPCIYYVFFLARSHFDQELHFLSLVLFFNETITTREKLMIPLGQQYVPRSISLGWSRFYSDLFFGAYLYKTALRGVFVHEFLPMLFKSMIFSSKAFALCLCVTRDVEMTDNG